mgnify:CR=1 FL=1
MVEISVEYGYHRVMSPVNLTSLKSVDIKLILPDYAKTFSSEYSKPHLFLLRISNYEYLSEQLQIIDWMEIIQ